LCFSTHLCESWTYFLCLWLATLGDSWTCYLCLWFATHLGESWTCYVFWGLATLDESCTCYLCLGLAWNKVNCYYTKCTALLLKYIGLRNICYRKTINDTIIAKCGFGNKLETYVNLSPLQDKIYSRGHLGNNAV
jgi:hypothetical protein